MKTITKKDFFDFLFNNKDFLQSLPSEFLEVYHSDFSEESKKDFFEDYFNDLFDEIRYQVADWYDNSSYYVKPEDILVDYTFCTHREAHKFLTLFLEELNK